MQEREREREREREDTHKHASTQLQHIQKIPLSVIHAFAPFPCDVQIRMMIAAVTQNIAMEMNC